MIRLEPKQAKYTFPQFGIFFNTGTKLIFDRIKKLCFVTSIIAASAIIGF